MITIKMTGAYHHRLGRRSGRSCGLIMTTKAGRTGSRQGNATVAAQNGWIEALHHNVVIAFDVANQRCLHQLSGIAS